MAIVNTLIYLFLPVMLLELFMGGGGRNLEFGEFTLRMYLFFFLLPLGAVALVARRIVDKYLIELLLLFTFVMLLAVFIGFYNDARTKYVYLDVKPLSYFFVVVFFYTAIRRIKHVKLVLQLLKFSAVVMALFYLICFVMINLQLLDFNSFYERMSISGEFFFRGEIAFFYKGFLYLGIGFIVFFSESKKRSKFIALLIFATLVLTFTRGFIVALVITYSAYYLLTRLHSYKTILVITFSIILIGGILIYFSFYEIGDKDLSNYFRIAQTKQVMERITPFTLIWGHGFGIGVPAKPIHMEITYLEIFHKQGIIGLFFYAYLFVLISNAFNRAVRNGNGYWAKPLFLAAMFVFAQSITNPFINNPIGMSMVLLSLVSLNVLAKDDSRFSLYSHI